MIILFYILAFIGCSSTQDLEVDRGCPTCVVVNTFCYNVTAILKLAAPFRKSIVIHEIGILRSRNTLYYSFEPTIEDEEYFKIGFVNLDNHTQNGVISSPKMILNFGTFDIDQDNELVYMGGSDGIFLMNTAELKLSPYSSRGDTIRNVFFKTNVNFAKNDDMGIIVKKGDNFKTMLEDTIVKNFVITKYDVIVYLNNFGLFVGKGDTRVRVSRNPYFRGLNIDLDGNVYAWWIDEIYKVIIEKTLEDSAIVKVGTLPVTIGAMAFDNDNYMLITVKKELFRLVPTTAGCKVKVVKHSDTIRA